MQYVSNCMTITSNSLSLHFQKHPHLRGENFHLPPLLLLLLETSPPTWGKRSDVRAVLVMGGNIPTYVGKTRFTNFESVIAMETSPPTWGKPRRRDRERPRPGNIPTYVGKTEHQWNNRGVMEKHPHLRGENAGETVTAAAARETSPPTWGKLAQRRKTPPGRGNIPTYVGKTASRRGER